jgi:hypothetical protein
MAIPNNLSLPLISKNLSPPLAIILMAAGSLANLMEVSD